MEGNLSYNDLWLLHNIHSYSTIIHSTNIIIHNYVVLKLNQPFDELNLTN